MDSCSRSAFSRRSSPADSVATTRTDLSSDTPCVRGRKASTSASSSKATPKSDPISTQPCSTSRKRSNMWTSSSSAWQRSRPGGRKRSMPEAALHVASGKVREIYELDDERLLLVASDRISTFDVVLPTEIPDKGRVLTGLSGFWFARTRDLVPNHLLALREDGRSTECKRLEMLPIECVVRGYLSGSGWKDYRSTGMVCGHRLPTGLAESAQLPEPIFTPSTKATTGHDENIDRTRALELIEASRYDDVERVSIELYRFASEHARAHGIIIADTKFEFGLDADGSLVLADEALTPDSSRFWPADEYRAGAAQPSFDKQFVRDYCESLGWDKSYPGPELPENVVAGTRARYVEAFERLTEIDFADYVAEPGVVLA